MIEETMKLKEYLKKHKITQRAFAEQMGVTTTTVARWCTTNEKWAVMPETETMRRITAATSGKVSANDFYRE